MEWHTSRLLLVLALSSFSLLSISLGIDDDGAYNYSATTECLSDPWPAFYGGGLIVNPEFHNDTQGWMPFGSAQLQLRSSSSSSSATNNSYLVAFGRKNSYDAPAQRLNLTLGNHYTISAWVQVSGDNITNAVVKATVKRKSPSSGTRYDCAGTVTASFGCWSLLKGGISVDDIDPSTPSTLYFESQDTRVEIWIDSVAVKPFTPQQWRAHQDSSVQQNRRGKTVLQVVDEKGRPVEGAKVEIEKTKMEFPIGSAIAKTILNNEAYQKWFVERFNVATFENEMKWYSTEPQRGKVRYNVSDAMVAWCKANNISIRGHTIFWEDPRYVQQWIQSLSAQELKEAVESRIRSVVGRYNGQLISWDVTNELLHFSYFDDKLSINSTSDEQLFSLFNMTQQVDPNVTLFLNDYNTLEECNDIKATPDQFIMKLKKLRQSRMVDLKLGIGLESHFRKPNMAFVRSSLDKLGSIGVPMWLTELDVGGSVGETLRVQYLEEILREAYSHPHVDGIVFWSAWHPDGCYRMCLTDNNFANLPVGDVVDRLLQEWKEPSSTPLLFTDEKGMVSVHGSFGEYIVTITHPSSNVSRSSFHITRNDESMLPNLIQLPM